MPFFVNSKKLYNELSQYIQNQVYSKTLRFADLVGRSAGVSHGGKRSVYDIYGYPESYSFEDGYPYLRREGIANRVCAGVPASCWRSGFNICTGDEEKPTKVLEDEIRALSKKGLFSRFERADTLNRVGKFAILYVGVPDGLELDQPLGRVRGDAIKSVFFRPYAEDGITIASYDTDPKSERYNLPETYQLQVMGRGDTDKDQDTQAIVVHHTRCIHMAEHLLDSEIQGVPALEPIFNRILDVDKTTGGASEAYFRNARGKMGFEIDPEFSSDLIADSQAKESFTDAAKKFTNDWEDQIIAIGAKINSINTPHYSPMDTFKVALQEISGNTGIPIRVLTGEGAGQLAGSEDRLTYNALINDRQDHVCTGWVDQLLKILNDSGVISVPENYFIEWPLAEPLTEIDQAELGNKRADTISKLTTAASSMGGDSINLKSAMQKLGLGDIDIDDMEITELPELPTIGEEDTSASGAENG